MNKNKAPLFILVFAFVCSGLAQKVYAETFFSGCTGLNTDFTADESASYLKPELGIQAFFAGQFTLNNNIFVHTEFSFTTSDLFTNSIFKKTPSEFEIDELSLIYRKQFATVSNYLSVFLGTYEAIGSDIFLQRQFGIQPISSHLMQNWLGLAGSIVYPLYGTGFSDVLHFNDQPIATGVYFYLNHEYSNYFVLNDDLRFACVYRYFTLDTAIGIGAPLGNEYQGNSVILLIDELYLHSGLNMLIGNRYTTSLFLQAGISGIPITRNSTNFALDPDSTYLLFEPRFKSGNTNFTLSLYCLPEDTVSNLLVATDSIGMNMLFCKDAVYIGSRCFSFGMNTALSLPDKTISDFSNASTIFGNGVRATFAPYFTMNLFTGLFHGMILAKPIIPFDSSKYWASLFEINLGYRTQL